MTNALKRLLSIIALAATAAGIAIGAGAFGKVDPAISELIITGGSLFAVFGVTPPVVTFAAARAGAFGALVVGGLVGLHVKGTIPGPGWLWHAIPVVGVLLGVIGRMGKPPGAAEGAKL